MWPVTIYYDGGATEICHDPQEWLDAHPFGVLACSWDDGNDFTCGRSYFFIAPWDYARPVSGDAGGLYDYLRAHGMRDRTIESFTANELIALGVKFGRMISTEDYSALIRPLHKKYNLQMSRRNLPERNLV